MDERDGKKLNGHGDVWAFLELGAAFVNRCNDYLVAMLRNMPDERRRQIANASDLLTADARAAELTRRFKERHDTLTYDKAVRLATGLTWNRIPYSRARNTSRPKDTLPFIYDYEILAVQALTDEALLKTLVEQSKTKKLAFDALQACIAASLRRDGTLIEGVLRAWASEVAGRARTRPHGGREQTTEVRDDVISKTVHTLTQCGLSKTRNETSSHHSACDAVGKVLGMCYATVVKACGRAAAA